MAEVQDEEQWLYGDDKEDSNAPEKDDKEESTSSEVQHTQIENEDSSTMNQDANSTEVAETNGEVVETSEKEPGEDSQDVEQNGEKSKEDGGDDSSSDDEPTVTIGKIVKQPDIMRPPPPTHRAAPTSGLKDEDFNSVGKINGVPVTDFNMAELEEKPWRKPGADLSDYFNYGFTEETWIKYCERQKSMRVNESGIGLAGLGVNIGKGVLGSSNIPVSIVNENSKYGGIGLRKPAGVPVVKPVDEMSSPPVSNTQPVNTIQVMTADRRSYSNKVLAGSGSGPGYDDMDFGGNPYGNDYFSTPPPSNYYNAPPPGPWNTIPNIPPPGWVPDTLGPPPVVPPHRGNSNYFEEDSMSSTGNFPAVRIKEEKDVDKARESRDSRSRSRERERDRDRDRERESRHHSSRRRSRSRSKSRHKKRSRSRSRSPSHRHKRKRSKRERELD